MKILRGWTSEHQNTVFVVGFSRGAAWVVDLALEEAGLFDAAIALAPYPWTRQSTDNVSEARQLMQVRAPVLLVHMANDEFCNAAMYPQWFAQFALAMESPVGNVYGQRLPTFVSCVVSGNHNTAHTMFVGLTLETTNHPQVVEWWRALWAV